MIVCTFARVGVSIIVDEDAAETPSPPANRARPANFASNARPRPSIAFAADRCDSTDPPLASTHDTKSYDVTFALPNSALMNTVIPGWLCNGIV